MIMITIYHGHMTLRRWPMISVTDWTNARNTSHIQLCILHILLVPPLYTFVNRPYNVYTQITDQSFEHPGPLHIPHNWWLYQNQWKSWRMQNVHADTITQTEWMNNETWWNEKPFFAWFSLKVDCHLDVSSVVVLPRLLPLSNWLAYGNEMEILQFHSFDVKRDEMKGGQHDWSDKPNFLIFEYFFLFISIDWSLHRLVTSDLVSFDVEFVHFIKRPE